MDSLTPIIPVFLYSVPFTRMPCGPLTHGDTPVIKSGYSAAKSNISLGSRFKVVPSPRPQLYTYIWFTPIFSTCCSTIPFKPLPREIITITAATPMIMPSMVKKARILLVIRDLMANLKDWVKFIRGPPRFPPPGQPPAGPMHRRHK